MLEEQESKKLFQSLQLQFNRIIDMCSSTTNPDVGLIAEIEQSITVAKELESRIYLSHSVTHPQNPYQQAT